MEARVSAMEFFGSQADDPVAACIQKIRECDILVGIYAWRYGWQPDPDSPSITEQEFDCAVENRKKCLCYIVDESYPWAPSLVDKGLSARRLKQFKSKVGKLPVVSRFTTPDDLAKQVKQVAADLGREMVTASAERPGELIRINSDLFSPELLGLLTAISQKPSGSPT
jgi:hypothetical protein